MKNRFFMAMLGSLVFMLMLSGCGEDDVINDGDEPSIIDPIDYELGSNDGIIIFYGDSIYTEGTGLSVNETVVTITAVGTYSAIGTLNDGQLLVDTEDEGNINIVLDGVDMTSATSGPIFIKSANQVNIILNEGSENYLTDADEYVYEGDDDEPNAALHSKANMTISGEGALMVTANYNDGITSKDGLVIMDGTYIVKAADDAIRGKDYLLIEGGSFSLEAGGDGLKSDHEADVDWGYITIKAGDFVITSENDGIQAETDLTIEYATMAIVAGGGYSAKLGSDVSAKGLKAGDELKVVDGEFDINTADDAIHSDNSIVIDGGGFVLGTGDDGIHGEVTLAVNGGNILIEHSYEGIESVGITINDGNIHVTSSDDGINAAGNSGRDNYLTINGGYIVVDADGDGLDANGYVEMNAGIAIVNGPTQRNNGALDYDATFAMKGGTLIAVGSSGMAQAPTSGTSSQYGLMAVFGENQKSANTLVHIQNEAGEDIVTFAPSKAYQSVVFSSPVLQTGTTYSLYFGGSSTGTETDGLYDGGTYSGGSLYKTFNISGTITTIQ
ncbi:carbohydrate-binding domain-containing protein [Flammeovirgaceae bacterium SG7u.111]|nr:carbohydrate-binding domain-containing protein [Flammeovirgaceae bacterium SG7u.132]WPO37139.1 carbohydrate-binding domain-containing protein [Flammeovirgaceae bacterium SG7u.111]